MNNIFSLIKNIKISKTIMVCVGSITTRNGDLFLSKDKIIDMVFKDIEIAGFRVIDNPNNEWTDYSNNEIFLDISEIKEISLKFSDFSDDYGLVKH